MNSEIENLCVAGRRALSQQDWSTVQLCANGILSRDGDNTEGYFLLGIAEKAAGRPKKANAAFEAVLSRDSGRYDAAIELASQYSMGRRNAEVVALLEEYSGKLDNSPRYLDMAGTVYTEIGLPEKAWPLFKRACELQPEISVFQANLATCAVFLGEIDVARRTYQTLLEQQPNHQRNHYQLARLAKAEDTTHIEQMQQVLKDTGLPPERNIFLYYAIGKEYEDLGMWDDAFDYYKRGGDAAYAIANYKSEDDTAIIDEIIGQCTTDWLSEGAPPPRQDKKPIFIVGLPRTGTTLTERIIASHSEVASIGETEFIQMLLRRESNIPSEQKMTPAMIAAVANKDIAVIRDGYVDQARYRLGDEPFFIDKLPFNVLYLGFIAKAWPEQPIVLLQRSPMDACFSMYKQVFTWAYKFSYNLDTLADNYIAYDRLCKHWRDLLGDRLVEVNYEDIVTDQEGQTRRLLERLGLEFEQACLDFDKNAAPSTTASSVQVRQKVHTDSVARWRRYEEQLEPLRLRLEAAGISTE
jgi:tetratricopeptide (TPR) repeat protein